ncbi:MAG TPA: outer membrane lipoprotein carrier protein LolA [Bacteroidales bacterium]|nr:outer membrane lipoprotein carrier protein LolA [Bacteroidales bacterium]
MKLTIHIMLLTLCTAQVVNGQVDPVATNILDKFSQKALSAPAVTMEFELNIVDEVEKSSTSSDGKLVIKDNMYKLELPDNIIWFDGSAVWTLAPEVEEVTINEPDTTNTSFISSPDQLFKLYRNGYKQRLLEETGRGSVIDLYPDEIDADFIRIRLLINGSYDLLEAEYKSKDGYIVFVKINNYDLRSRYDNAFFLFDRNKYPNVDIIDMR